MSSLSMSPQRLLGGDVGRTAFLLISAAQCGGWTGYVEIEREICEHWIVMSSRREMWIYSSLSHPLFSRIHFFLFLHLLSVNDVRAAVKDEVETVEVTEGDTVTLKTDLTGIKRDDMIRWMFGSTDTRIAQLFNRDTLTHYDERFRDRLQLDTQTGSLIISNTRTTDSGPYKLQIISDQVSNKRFNVTVYATLPVPNITDESLQNHSQSKSSPSPGCFVVCSVWNGHKVTLSWYNGSDLLSSISDLDNSSLSLPLDIEHCDTNTYSCVAANPITNQTIQLNTSCTQSCPSNGSRFLLWPILFLLLLPLVLVVIFLLHRSRNKPKTTQPVQAVGEEVLYAETQFCAKRVQDMRPDELEETVYSAVVT